MDYLSFLYLKKKKFFYSVITDPRCSFYFLSALKFSWFLKIRINALHQNTANLSSSSALYMLFSCFPQTCAVLTFLSTLSMRDGWQVSGIFWRRLKGLRRHEQTRLMETVKQSHYNYLMTALCNSPLKVNTTT